MGLFFKLNTNKVFPLFIPNFKRNIVFEQDVINTNLCNVAATSNLIMSSKVILCLNPSPTSQNSIAVYTQKNEHIGWISDIPNNNNISICNNLRNNIPVLASVSEIKKNSRTPYIRIAIALYEPNKQIQQPYQQIQQSYQPLQESYQSSEVDNINYINYHKVRNMFPNDINGYIYDREHGECVVGIKHHDVNEAMNLQIGDTIILEPCSSEFDSKGIKLLSVRNKHIGWIPADSTYKSVIFSQLNDNIPVLAKIYVTNKTPEQLQTHGAPFIKIIVVEYTPSI